MTETNLYSIREVAHLLKKQPYQITYVLSTGKVTEPKVRLGNRRAFDSEEVEALREYFYPEKGGRNA